ncbi:MAG: hypothetical protein ACRD3R_13355, partial [Terriglobales bacterium]
MAGYFRCMTIRVARLVLFLCAAGVAGAAGGGAQKPDTGLVPGKRMVRAVQYPYDIKVKFQLHATGRAEGALGNAEVRRRKSGIEVEVEVEEAPAASQLRPEYRGYVVWALTPDGKFVNLGSIERKGSLRTTTTLP